ncbi:glycoside hydrolase family 18 [Catenulispora acidiphila DSM 44928]|uniref:chitinase n=1 Tax=Catenulispora acidiphila (strain DSM 44928 / JCM 14897 / NBRC 102108 / NRRL B-24433 / ID139908) TaxID=479433 RepID=C7QIB2_CATAD|nr:glycoside hydrolase family 18 protein [Catenulispora acidiphila]ACU74989.1 glycoside hydrolase family 18 [Catenulispora acidiphila DSM 44928]
MARPSQHHRNRRVGLAAAAVLSLAIVPVAAASPALATPGSAAASAAASASSASSNGKVSVGYFTQWGIYSGFYEKNLIASGAVKKLTEIDYAFSNIAPDGTCASADAWADWQKPVDAANSVDGTADTGAQSIAGNFNQLRELKKAYPNLKIVMAIGGWSESTNFSAAAATPASRAKFAQSCIDMYIKGNLPGVAPGAAAGIFDGISIDWEYPDGVGDNNPHGPQDTHNFTLLLQELRNQLDTAGRPDGKHYLLTADMPAGPENVSHIEIGAVSRILDWMNVMTFDFHGTWETTGPTNFQSNLFPSPFDPAPRATSSNPFPVNGEISTLQVVMNYLQHGATPNKIALSIPLYAHGWTGVAPGPRGDGLYQPATGVATDVVYNQVAAQPGTVHHDPITGAVYKYDPASKTFWTYDDPQSIQEKVLFIKALGLRGDMAWSMDGDTADGALVNAFGLAK